MEVGGASMLADKAASAGAEQIIRYYLGLAAGQELLVFVDETMCWVGRRINDVPKG